MEETNLFFGREPRMIEVLSQYWRESKYSYRNIPRPSFGFMYVTRGGVDFVTAEATVSVKAGDTVFLPKGCRYEAVFRGETEDILVNFDATDADVLLAPKFLFPASERLASLFEELAAAATLAEMRPWRTQGLFYLLADALVCETRREDDPHAALLEKVYRLLHSDEEISLAEIARACAVSESGLRRIFKEKTGKTLLAERRDFRIKEAKRLLENTDLSLAEIAERLHFFDAAYFSRIFHRTVGVTPGTYAKQKKVRI